MMSAIKYKNDDATLFGTMNYKFIDSEINYMTKIIKIQLVRKRTFQMGNQFSHLHFDREIIF